MTCLKQIYVTWTLILTQFKRFRTWVAKERNIKPYSIFHTVSRVHERCQGAYGVWSLVMVWLVSVIQMVFVLWFAWDWTRWDGIYHCIRAITALGFKIERDIAPGEALIQKVNYSLNNVRQNQNMYFWICLFCSSRCNYWWYYKARLKMGEKLAHKILRVKTMILMWLSQFQIPAVLRTCKYSWCEVPRRLYEKPGRTFIMPGQQQRKKSVRQTLLS